MRDAATMLNAVADQMTTFRDTGENEGKMLYQIDAYQSLVAKLGQLAHQLGEEVELYQ